jgi:hypothetical protein
MATLEPAGNESALTFADGRAIRYLWRKLRVSSNEYVWADGAGRAIVQF